jgi:hypothetical protein
MLGNRADRADYRAKEWIRGDSHESTASRIKSTCAPIALHRHQKALSSARGLLSVSKGDCESCGNLPNHSRHSDLRRCNALRKCIAPLAATRPPFAALRRRRGARPCACAPAIRVQSHSLVHEGQLTTRSCDRGGTPRVRPDNIPPGAHELMWEAMPRQSAQVAGLCFMLMGIAGAALEPLLQD